MLLSAFLLVACASATLSNPKVELLLAEAKEASLKDDRTLQGKKLEAAVKEAEVGECSISQMKALNSMAAFSDAEGRAEKCLTLYEDARAVGVDLKERNSSICDSPEYQIEQLKALSGLANHERDLGRFSSALRHYGEARVFHERLAGSSPVKESFEADFRKCLSDQRDQEAIEHLVVSGESLHPKTPEAVELKTNVINESKSIMNSYDDSDPASIKKRLLELSELIVTKWGRDDETYQDVLHGLFEIACRSGDFVDLDRILQQDLKSMPVVDEAIRTGKHVAPSEISELSMYIDTLMRQAEVACAKHDADNAKKLNIESLRLVEQYLPEDGLRTVACYRRLGECLQLAGDYDEAAHYEEKAIAVLAKKPKFGYQPRQLQMLGLDRVYEGNFVQAVNIAGKLINRGAEAELNAALSAVSLRLLYEVAVSIGDFTKARIIADRMHSLLKGRPGLFSNWKNTLLTLEVFLDLKQGKLTKLIAERERDLSHEYTHNFRKWLIYNDLLCYANFETGNIENAERYLKKIEATKRHRWQDQTYLSKVTKVRMSLNAQNKFNLDACVDSLIKCIENLGHPSRLAAAESIVLVADELNSLGKLDAAERLYKSILKIYAKVPNRADSTLIDVLKNYHLLLLKQNNRDVAFQISARWESKRQQFAVTKSETEKRLKSIN